MSKQQFHFYGVGMPVQVLELLKCIYTEYQLLFGSR